MVMSMGSPRAGRPLDARRNVVTSGGAGTGVAMNVIYAALATLILFVVSAEARRIFFEPRPTADEQLVQSTAPAAAGGVARRAAGSSEGREGEGAIDPGVAGEGPMRLDPSTPREQGPALDATDTGSHPTDAASTRAAGKSSWNVMSTLVHTLSSGGEAVSGAPANNTKSAPSRSDPAASLRSRGGQVADIFFSTDEGTACQPGNREFALTAVPNLYVCVVWKGLSGKYAEQLTFVLPDGNVYQTMTVPFMTIDMPATADPAIEVAGRTLVAKRAGWGANGATLVTAALPVSGTYITQYTLAGLWTVQVALDGHRIDQNNFELLTQ